MCRLRSAVQNGRLSPEVSRHYQDTIFEMQRAADLHTPRQRFSHARVRSAPAAFVDPLFRPRAASKDPTVFVNKHAERDPTLASCLSSDEEDRETAMALRRSTTTVTDKTCATSRSASTSSSSSGELYVAIPSESRVVDIDEAPAWVNYVPVRHDRPSPGKYLKESSGPRGTKTNAASSGSFIPTPLEASGSATIMPSRIASPGVTFTHQRVRSAPLCQVPTALFTSGPSQLLHPPPVASPRADMQSLMANLPPGTAGIGTPLGSGGRLVQHYTHARVRSSPTGSPLPWLQPL